MESMLLELGVGGLFAVMLVRETRSILEIALAKRRNANGNGNGAVHGRRQSDQETLGEKAPEYLQIETRKAATEAFSSTVKPLLLEQVRILGEIRGEQRRLSDEILKMAARRENEEGRR